MKSVEQGLAESMTSADSLCNAVSLEPLSAARSEYIREINRSKKQYEAHEYNDLATSCQSNSNYYSLLKKIYNGDQYPEAIPPIENDNEIITDDLEKAEVFNTYFKQASYLDDSNATLPDYQTV